MTPLRLTAALCLLALLGCSPAAEEPAPEASPPPVPVEVQPAAEASVQRSVAVLGSLFPEEESQLTSQVAGVVLRVRADVGDVVSASAVLAELDPTDFELAASVARFAYERALAQLGLEELPRGELDLAQVAAVARARAELANARVKLGRLRELAREDEGYVAAQDLQDASTSVAVAEANLDVERLAARARLAEARQRQAELAQARERLSDTRLRAPAGARSWAVAAREVAVGESVAQGGEALFRLVSSDPVELRARVPEAQGPRVQVGQRVRLRVEAYPERVFEGRLTRITPTVEVESRTFGVRVEVPNPRGELRPGSFAKAEILTGEAQVVLVPLEAVVSVAGVDKVFVREGQRVRQVLVEVGLRHGERVEVSEVRPGQEVVVRGQTVVTDGAAVELQAPRQPEEAE